MLSWIVLHTMADPLLLKCGLRNGSGINMFWEYRDRSLFFEGEPYSNEHLSPMYYVWHSLCIVTLQIWDLTTMGMYSCKIWKFGKKYKNKDDGVWSNLLLIMYRIVTVTIFYEVSTLFIMVVNVGLAVVGLPEFMENTETMLYDVVLPSLVSILMSLSMYLMMEHNTSTYVDFLRFLRGVHLHSLCFCCCRGIVDSQLVQYDAPEVAVQNVKRQRTVNLEETMHTNISSDAEYRTEEPSRSLDTGDFTFNTFTEEGQA